MSKFLIVPLTTGRAVILRTAACLLICLAAVGCIGEDRSDCPGVTVRVEVDPPEDRTAIQDVVIYIFGSGGEFLERRETQLGRVENLSFPNAGTLTVVCWCNTQDGSVDVARLGAGSNIDDGVVSLRNMPPNANIPEPLVFSPGDLFFGSVTVANSGTREDAVLPVSRHVASLVIRVHDLIEFTGIDDDNYSLVVGTTKNQADFAGRFFGDDVSYLPTAGFDAQNDLVTPVFNLFPSLEGEFITVRIYHDDDLIYEATVNDDGGPLQAIRDRTLNILIDFTVGVSVSVRAAEWGIILDLEKIIN